MTEEQEGKAVIRSRTPSRPGPSSVSVRRSPSYAVTVHATAAANEAKR